MPTVSPLFASSSAPSTAPTTTTSSAPVSGARVQFFKIPPRHAAALHASISHHSYLIPSLRSAGLPSHLHPSHALFIHPAAPTTDPFAGLLLLQYAHPSSVNGYINVATTRYHDVLLGPSEVLERERALWVVRGWAVEDPAPVTRGEGVTYMMRQLVGMWVGAAREWQRDKAEEKEEKLREVVGTIGAFWLRHFWP